MSTTPTYAQLLSALLPPSLSAPILPSPSSTPHLPSLTPHIASLRLHPTLESLLHILNADLPSAHFLLRHMQSPDPPRPPTLGSSYAAAASPTSPPTPAPPRATTPPADPPKAEGQLLHALLHRIELDTANARAWYADVAATAPVLFAHAWPAGLPSVDAFLARVQRVRGTAPQLARHEQAAAEEEEAVAGEVAALRRESEREIRAVLGWCEERYGTGAWEDASGEWRGHGEKVAAMAQKMVVGGEGWRQF